jgi:hypothetical protein
MHRNIPSNTSATRNSQENLNSATIHQKTLSLSEVRRNNRVKLLPDLPEQGNKRFIVIPAYSRGRLSSKSSNSSSQSKMITDCGVLPVKNTKSKRCNMLPPSMKMHPSFPSTSYRFVSMGEMICQSYVITDIINCLTPLENVRL